MPLLTELASTPNIGNCEDRLAVLNEFEGWPAEERVNGNVETAVSYDPRPSVSSRALGGKGTSKRTVLEGRSSPV